MFYNSKEQVSRKDAKAQRKALFFAPLRALRETSFSSNYGKTPHFTKYFYSNGLMYNDDISGLRNPYIANSCLAALREAGASKTSFPSRSFTAIPPSSPRHRAKVSLTIAALTFLESPILTGGNRIQG